MVDSTALLEALKERIEQAVRGEVSLNRALADAVVGRVKHPTDPVAICRAPSAGVQLTQAQIEALQKALKASIAYIWGPPGSGKTFVLGEVVRSAFAEGKRVLICSNTNKAVDQVLFRICETLGTHHPAMEEGRIVRLGQATDDKLKSKYEYYVTVDGIVERRSVELKARQRRVQEETARIDIRTTKAREILGRFSELDSAQTTVLFHKETAEQVVKLVSELNANQESVVSRLEDLEKELRKRNAALFGGLFKRSEEAIRRDIARAHDRQAGLLAEIEKAKTQYTAEKEKYETARLARNHLAEQLSKLDGKAAEQEIARGDAARAPLVVELREIETELAEVRSAVLRNAKVLGATCTKTYLSVKEIGQVDMVIIDEASMVLLPMVWFSAGLSKERAVICGDFRQLPPILQTRQQAVFDVLGLDVFEAAKLDGRPSIVDPRMVMLDSQHRMHDDICQLISRPMYGGVLRTGTQSNGRKQATAPPPPYDGTLTIVDTADLWPFESVDAFFSRFNLMHALLVRNLAWHFRQRGYVREREDLAVCTPYAAQAKLISTTVL